MTKTAPCLAVVSPRTSIFKKKGDIKSSSLFGRRGISGQMSALCCSTCSDILSSSSLQVSVRLLRLLELYTVCSRSITDISCLGCANNVVRSNAAGDISQRIGHHPYLGFLCGRVSLLTRPVIRMRQCTALYTSQQPSSCYPLGTSLH